MPRKAISYTTKRVNDQHGHLAGSRVLREVGQLLQRTVTSPGAMLARYGGNEFVLTLPGLDLDAAVSIAEEIRSEIVETTFSAHPGDIQPEPLRPTGITASIGVTTLRRHVRPDARNVSTILRQRRFAFSEPPQWWSPSAAG